MKVEKKITELDKRDLSEITGGTSTTQREFDDFKLIYAPTGPVLPMP